MLANRYINGGDIAKISADTLIVSGCHFVTEHLLMKNNFPVPFGIDTDAKS